MQRTVVDPWPGAYGPAHVAAPNALAPAAWASPVPSTGSGTVVRIYLAVALGWLLVFVVAADVFRTVLWSGQGAGPLTSVVTASFRRLLPLLPGRRRTLSAVGPVALLVIASIWAVSLVLGFTLTLQVDPDAIRTSSTNAPADWVQRAYFVGYTIFTLGNGGLAPVTDAGRFITVAISATGLFLITLSVTYLLPVVSASVASRAFASSALSLGDGPQDMVLVAWDGERIQLDHQLRELSNALSLLAQQQLAYPVLHLFHSSDRGSSAPLAVAQLDDLLTVLDGVDQRVAPLPTPRRQLRSAIRSFLGTYTRNVGGSDPPPAPGTDRLAAAGVPLLDSTAYAMVVDDLQEHRADVRDLVRAAGIDDW
jgi:hypothetical protein